MGLSPKAAAYGGVMAGRKVVLIMFLAGPWRAWPPPITCWAGG
jgi:hypothetical protein